MKKLLLLSATVFFVMTLTFQAFAYSDMYMEGSNIPDFTEVTGMPLVSKTYQSDEKIKTATYTYVSPVTEPYNINIISFLNLLEHNGYELINLKQKEQGDIVYARNYNRTMGVVVSMPDPNYFYSNYYAYPTVTIAEIIG